MLLTSEALHAALQGDVRDAARALLGAHLVRGERRARIVEVEAYRGEDDPGSHAFRGETPRTKVMFGPAGIAYVYFTYGMHWMLNVVAHEEGRASAVLVRAAEPLTGIDEMRACRQAVRAPVALSRRLPDRGDEPTPALIDGRRLRDTDLLSGPAKIARAFEITGKDNGTNLLDPTSDLRVEPSEQVREVLVGTRIGLAHGKGHEKPWRFADADAIKWVSRPLTFGAP